MLRDHGLTDVWPLKGGIEAWEEAGLPVEEKD
jgi:rhodanese-related sulfurtransferase